MHNQVTMEFGGFIIISAFADDVVGVIRWWPPAHTSEWPSVKWWE